VTGTDYLAIGAVFGLLGAVLVIDLYIRRRWPDDK